MAAEDADHAYRMGRHVGRMDWQGACHSGGLVGVREEVVAKGGIEPPTHGFSVRCSTD